MIETYHFFSIEVDNKYVIVGKEDYSLIKLTVDLFPSVLKKPDFAPAIWSWTEKLNINS